jgi:hypothetical protein
MLGQRIEPLPGVVAGSIGRGRLGGSGYRSRGVGKQVAGGVDRGRLCRFVVLRRLAQPPQTASWLDGGVGRILGAQSVQTRDLFVYQSIHAPAEFGDRLEQEIWTGVCVVHDERTNPVLRQRQSGRPGDGFSRQLKSSTRFGSYAPEVETTPRDWL